MRLLIGIDDTDNKESRGTGFNARQLAAAIEQSKLGKVLGITRHQLYVHPAIPYTSQNSSACLDVKTDGAIERMIHFCRNFMQRIAADGSDVGLCIAKREEISEEIAHWGLQAKSIVLNIEKAMQLSNQNAIFLEGLTGTNDGIIGAMAAVGLRKAGNDGRFIWLNASIKLRDIEQGIYTVEELIGTAGVDIVQSIENENIKQEDKVFLNGWARPVLKNNKAVLLVEKIINNSDYEWRCAAKELVKNLSN